MLPNFLIIGAARSGTTALYYGLREHPQVFMPAKKELNFFTSNWKHGLEWYGDFFQSQTGQPAIGEASPGYTFNYASVVVQRIAEVIPEAKLIYMVRHPAERAYSHYLHYRYTLQKETRPFSDAIKQDESYLSGSSYYQWIMRYHTHLEQKQMLILLFEEFEINPQACFQQIFEFLGVDPTFIPHSASRKINVNYDPRNKTLQSVFKRLAKSKGRYIVDTLLPASSRSFIRNLIDRSVGTHSLPEMTPEIRTYLLQYFQEDTQRLAAYLGRDLSPWLV
jgi:hypothetical protein